MGASWSRSRKRRVRPRLEINVKPAPSVLLAPLANRIAWRGHVEDIPRVGSWAPFMPHPLRVSNSRIENFFQQFAIHQDQNPERLLASQGNHGSASPR